jgi:hypothetical protein
MNAVVRHFGFHALHFYDFKTLGFHFLSALFRGEAFEDHFRFPRVTFCDLDIRQMTNVQTWTVQCSLPINLFNEKLFCINWLRQLYRVAMIRHQLYSSKIYYNKWLSIIRSFVVFLHFNSRGRFYFNVHFPLNLFNEKLFCINWLMLVFMAIVNTTSFLYNFVSIFLPFRHRNYVRKFLVPCCYDTASTVFFQNILQQMIVNNSKLRCFSSFQFQRSFLL